MKESIFRLNCVGPEFQETEFWYVLQDNVPTNSSYISSEFLFVKRGFSVLPHPLHSPDIAPAEFLYPQLNEIRIQQTVTTELKAIREQAFPLHSIRCSISDTNVVRCYVFTAVTSSEATSSTTLSSAVILLPPPPLFPIKHFSTPTYLPARMSATQLNPLPPHICLLSRSIAAVTLMMEAIR